MAEQREGEERRLRQDKEKDEYRQARRERLGHVEEYERESAPEQPSTEFDPEQNPELRTEPVEVDESEESKPRRGGRKKKDEESEA